MKKIIKKILTFVVPYRIWLCLSQYELNSFFRWVKYRAVLSENKSLKNIHQNASRCFILCNGPSINDQNLDFLADEIVFSVSSGYLYKNYLKVAPEYHCVPRIYYNLVNEGDILAWLREMDASIVSKDIFLSLTELPLVQKNDLFQGRNIHYLNFGKGLDGNKMADLTGIIPIVATAPIMCLMIAMYMGFKEIYLLGTEHDSFKSNKYKYAFEPTVLKGKDPGVDAAGNMRVGMFYILQTAFDVWRQYRLINEIARLQDIKIFNATLGGALDEFERVSVTDLIVKN